MEKPASSIHDLLSDIKEKGIEILILTNAPYYEIHPPIRNVPAVKIDFVGEDYFLTSDECKYPINFLSIIRKGVI